MNTPPGLRNIRIDKAVYYPIFIYNVVLLDYLKEKCYWWDTHFNNKYIKNYDGRLIAEVPRIYR